MSRSCRQPTWKGPLRTIVSREADGNLLECGHRAPITAGGYRKGYGRGVRQRCTVCPAEPPRSYAREERQAAAREAKAS